MDTTLLARGRPVLVLDPAAFLGRLGIPGPALECAPLQGRLMTAVPIRGEAGADALLLVVIDDPSPEPGALRPAGDAGRARRRRAAPRAPARRPRARVPLDGHRAGQRAGGQGRRHPRPRHRDLAARRRRRPAPRPARRRAARPGVRRRAARRGQDRDPRRDPQPPRARCSDDEWEHVRDHTRIGERILRDIPFLAPRPPRSAPRTSAGTAAAIPTASPASPSRWRPASSSPATRGA